MNKTILITGATGLIGKETILPLINAGFTIFTLSSKEQPPNKDITWIPADLFDEELLKTYIKQIKPEYLLHFAWNTKEGYLTSELNEKYLDSSLKLLKIFSENGGRRAVFAGTAFEYDFKDTILKEDDAVSPATPYAKCKNMLHTKAELFVRENRISFGWGRIFYVLGHRENKNRLLPYIVDSLRAGNKAIIKGGPLIRDYMYSKDIAAAFVKFLESDISGCVNICTGMGISIRDLALKIAGKLGKQNLLDFQDDIGNQPKMIVGDNTRLTGEAGYIPQWNLDDALNNILSEVDNG
jgi:nucleoside-diphosphate-sugar epimerase